MKFLYLLFASTVFLSSFLLFQIQPLIGKHILAWFGGSSAVWVTAMFFFMVALAIGYLYALLLSSLRPFYQASLHTLIIVATLASLYTHSQVWPSAITPTLEDLAISFSEPTLAVFITLLITIGLPFTLLSSTSSLVQFWYAKVSGREPFPLYGISNLGSLLGLLSYPLLFEPFLNTYTQGTLWSASLLIYIFLLVTVMVTFVRRSDEVKLVAKVNQVTTMTSKQNLRLFFIWLLVASVPVMVLLAGTSFMTAAIAPIPFLWVGPLALYLISFIFTFRVGARLPAWTNEVLVVITAILTISLVIMSEARVAIIILVIHWALFSISHWCHEYLYSLRPDTKGLTLFYVALSLGGILGSIIIKFSSSFLLVMPIELMVILVVSTLVIAVHWFKQVDYYIPKLTKTHLRIISGFIILVMIGSGGVYIETKQKLVIAAERNFFGYKAVIDATNVLLPNRSMRHGMTNHGYQLMENGQLVIESVAYYGDSSGIGMAFAYLRSLNKKSLAVVVAGLGSGALAAHCIDNDEFTFIEIDEEIIYLAQKYFTYLDACTNHTIKVGDARLTLAKEREVSYDLIILDAYADDMMPIHLMTTEAISLYKTLLKPGGIIAVHISSRYLDLLPVLKALAIDNDLSGRYWFDKSPQNPRLIASNWVLLTNQPEVFLDNAFTNLAEFPEELRPLLWTDTYSALLPIVRF